MVKTLFCSGALVALLVVLPGRAEAATYDVGPGKPSAHRRRAVGDAGSRRRRPHPLARTPYEEKWVTRQAGHAGSAHRRHRCPRPRGRASDHRRRERDDRARLDYGGPRFAAWSRSAGSIAGGTPTPQWIVDREPRRSGARTRRTRSPADRVPPAYNANASAIYVEKGDHITIRNCHMHDCGNGFLLRVPRSQRRPGRALLIRATATSARSTSTTTTPPRSASRSSATASARCCPGAGGNNLKDRSAGTGRSATTGSRAATASSTWSTPSTASSSAIRATAQTFVYGNVLVETGDDGNSQIVHYGGDSGTTANYRKGTLYFYNNTVVSAARTTRRCSACRRTRGHDVRNNIVYYGGGGPARCSPTTGTLLPRTGSRPDGRHSWRTGRKGTITEQRHRHRHVARVRERSGPGLPSHRGLSGASIPAPS